MVEEIEEKLEEKFEKLKIEVKYVKIKTYLITVGTTTIFYTWQDKFTFDSNIEQIVYYIKLFKEGKK